MADHFWAYKFGKEKLRRALSSSVETQLWTTNTGFLIKNKADACVSALGSDKAYFLDYGTHAALVAHSNLDKHQLTALQNGHCWSCPRRGTPSLCQEFNQLDIGRDCHPPRRIQGCRHHPGRMLRSLHWSLFCHQESRSSQGQRKIQRGCW